MSRKILALLLFSIAFQTHRSYAQSMNCATATSIDLSSGSACVNGTNAGAISDNILYGTCNASPVDVVWYTYVANGSNNTFTVDPGTMTNAEIIIYTGNCPNGAGAQLEYCTTSTGGNNINTTWGMVAGQQVWVGVASTTLNDGTFQLCINSTPPAPGPGNTCAQAVPICTLPFNQANIPNNSSGQAPSCFGSAPQQDIFVQFTVTQAGTLAWTATCPPATEYDWALWNISSGCPGTLVCCNYNYASGSGNGFGMQNSAGNVACGNNGFGNDNAEFSPTINVTCGQTYAIQISNYSNNNNGFNLSFTNSTCQISSNANFSVTPSLVCGTSLNATINDASTGDCAAVWDYGDGTTYTGGTPPSHNYTTPGTYAITETIGGACPSTHTEFVQLLAPVAATVTATNTGCAGSCTGTASVTAVSGGDGIYTYSWAPGGQTTSTLSGLCAGTYTATVSNALCGTSVTNTVTVVAPVTPTVTVNSATMCPGNSTTLTASGASTYAWSPATGLSSTTGASVTASPTVTTTYTVTGTAIGGCTATAVSTVTIGGSITPTVNNATLCAGNSATLTASGGTTYTWSPATGLSGTTGATVTASPTVNTTYTLTAASGGCTGTTTAAVTVNPLPTVTVNSASVCIGTSTTLNASGANTYTWSPASGLSATTGASVTANPTVTTTYTITGMSAASCTAIAVATLTVNPVPTVTVSGATYCTGGSATLTAGGANSYTWSPGTGLSSTTGASVTANPTVTTNYTVTGATAAGCANTATTSVTVVTNPTLTVASATICINNSTSLSASGASTYTWSPATGLSATTGASVTASPTTTTVYTITGSAGTCSAVTTATVTVNSLPVVSVNSGTICAGQTTTTLTAGGASTYTWNPATGLSASNGASVTANPGSTTNYTVSATDANGCVNTATTSVTVNTLPTVTVNSDLICIGGSTTLTAGGASTYTWNPSAGLSSATGSPVTANPGSTTSYTVTGTDANGCYSNAVSTVTVVANPTVTVTSATICVGQQTATLTASGASSYAWTPSTGLSATTGSTVNGTPGSTTTYTVTGTAGTCSAVATSTITVNSLPVINVNTGTICVGQTTATLTAGGGATYTWSPSTGLSSPNGSPVTATPGSTTAYTVSGTDANGCVNSATTAVTVNPLPTVTVNSDLICVGGSTTLTAGGASTYTWNPATGLSASSGSSVSANPGATSSYTVTGTDANGCYSDAVATVTVVANPTVTVNTGTICVGQQTATLTASGASSYVWSPGTGLSSTTGSVVTANPGATTIYTITGTAGTCTAVTTTTVNVNPLPLVLAGSNSPVCVNQSIVLTATGGVAYSWSGPGGFSAAQATDSISAATLGNAGVYTVTATDANGCINSDTATVVVNPLPVVTVTGATVCVNQTINLGCNNSGVTYSWTGPNLFSSNQQNPSIGNATTTMTGNYVVTVTDANGCSSGNVASVVVNPSLVINASAGTVCENGTLSLSSDAGVSWSWSGPNGYSSNLQNPGISNALPGASGVYTVVATDVNGCSGSDTATAVVNPLPTLSVNSATICVTQQTATLTANGASSYTWTPASTLNSNTGSVVTATPLLTTTYTITGTDVNGCVNSTVASVTVNSLPNVSATSATICAGNSATLNASGAVSYAWAPAGSLSSGTGSPVLASPASSTTYTVVGTDANGCYNAGTCTVTINPLPSISVNSASICNGSATSLNAAGANTYAWSPAAGLSGTSGSTVSASPTSTATYIVTGTDINGCANADTAVVTVNPLPVLNVGPALTTGCAPLCVVFTNSTTATGACNWSMGDGSTSNNCLPAYCYTVQGTYNAVLTLTDGNGCVGTDSATIVVYPVPDADFTFSPQPASVFEPNINFYDNSSGAVINNWSWNFGDAQNSTSSDQNPGFTYPDAGDYSVQLTVVSNYGCVDSITKTVVIEPMYSLYVPNAFSPNFDGTNDVFMAKGEGVKDFKIYIFDRWGNLVYYSDDMNKGWDGRFKGKGDEILQEDVYVWKIEARNIKNETKLLKGTVSLLK